MHYSAKDDRTSTRLPTIDILRGIAILGIIAMNIVAYAFPQDLYLLPNALNDLSEQSILIWFTKFILIDGKCYAILSTLFGVGIYLFTQHKANDDTVGRLHFRRMAALMLIGVIHAYLLWYGDVLFAYGLCGCIIFLMRELSGKIMVAGFLVATLIAFAFMWLLFNLFLNIDEEFATTMIAELLHDSDQLQEQIANAQVANLAHWKDNAMTAFEAQISNATYYIFAVGRYVLLGFWMGKIGLFEKRYPTYVLALAGAVLFSIGVYFDWQMGESLIAVNWEPTTVLASMWRYEIITPFSALGFLLLITALLQTGFIGLHWLKPVGKLALTHYITQSLVCTFIFYGWGLGQFATWEYEELAYLVLAIWVWQIGISQVYFKCFSVGPMEWVWRQLYYWRWNPAAVVKNSVSNQS